MALTILILAASLFFLTIWRIPLASGAGTSGHPEHSAGLWVTIALWALAAMCLIVAVRKPLATAVRKLWPGHGNDDPSHLRSELVTAEGQQEAPGSGRVQSPGARFLPDLLNVQFVLLAVAILLTSTAAYGALRLETASQADAVAEIGDSLQVNDQYDVLSVSVSASKLAARDWLSVVVSAIPRQGNWDIATTCASRESKALRQSTGLSCEGDPCYYFGQGATPCPRISGDVIAPDSSGGVQRTLQVPFSPSAYQHLQIVATTCAPVPSVPGECYATGSSTRLDIPIPQPSKPSG
jgi:hypothetical protein